MMHIQERFKEIGFISLMIPLLSAQAPEAWARGLSGGDELKNSLSTGGGIASPSVTSALGENPAGLVHHSRSKFYLTTATGSDQLNPLGYGGSFFTGNGSVGGGIALQGFNSQMGGSSTGSILLLNWGLAATFDNLNFAFGFTGTRTLRRSGNVEGTGSGTTWCVDTGIIINPRGSNRWGITAFQVLDNVDAVGLGYATDVSSWATLALDSSYTLEAKTTVLKPGLTLNLPDFQMTSGYGFRALGSSWSWIRQGLSLGLAVPIGQRFKIEGYYNQIARYYLGFTTYL